jgi:Icc-related predicted phosphoesterase
MRALVLSDLHLEFRDFDLVHNGRTVDDGADVIILAGDIALGNDGISWARMAFPSKPVVYVVGNHEFYRQTYERHLEDLRQVAKNKGVHLLEQDRIEIDGITFLGAALWTDFKLFGEEEHEVSLVAAQFGLNDFRLIRTEITTDDQEVPQLPRHPAHRHPGPRKFMPRDAARIHAQTVAWLSDELAAVDPAKTIVVTHHAPHRMSVHPKYDHDELTPAFASDLEHLMGRSRYWVHGHMHDGQRYVVNGTEVVLNPRGYPLSAGGFENALFNPALQIEI